MLKMNDDLEGALKEYLLLLDKEEYFEAHEVLEEAWHPLRLSKHPLRNLVKGFINGAITFEHIKRNRKNVKDKAQRVIASYERYKDLCTESIEYAALFKQARQKIESLKIKHAEVFDVLVP
jgi:predicted metal-dependent hydrolase